MVDRAAEIAEIERFLTEKGVIKERPPKSRGDSPERRDPPPAEIKPKYIDRHKEEVRQRHWGLRELAAWPENVRFEDAAVPLEFGRAPQTPDQRSLVGSSAAACTTSIFAK
jgi:hypothetical protein